MGNGPGVAVERWPGKWDWTQHDAVGIVREQGQGQVTAQDPLANTQARKGATVIISVSTGAPIVEVPDVRNKTAEQATEALTAAGFRVVPNLVNSDTKEPNTVIDQAPAAGTRQPKGSNITLTISKGVEQIVVPNVRGLAASDASQYQGQRLRWGAGAMQVLRTDDSRVRQQRIHAAARQTPLTVIGPARKKDPTVLIENRSRAAESQFPLPADPFTVKNLCHVDIPLSVLRRIIL